MFSLLKGKKAKLREKRQKVRAVISKRRRGGVTDSELDLLGEDILDTILMAGYVNDIYFSQMGVEPDGVEDVAASVASEDTQLRNEVFETAAAAREEYQERTPAYTPDPEPVTRSAPSHSYDDDTPRYSGGGGSSYSGSSDSGSSGSSDSGSSDSGSSD